MIKIPKKQLYNFKYCPGVLKKILFPRKIPGIFFFFFLFFLAPISVNSFLSPNTAKPLFLFCLSNFCILALLLKKYTGKKYSLLLQQGGVQEKINVLLEKKSRELNNQAALSEKISRYASLKNIIEDINQNLNLDFVANSLADIAFSLIAKNKGTCVLYLIDSQTQKPALFKTKKENKELVIKTKEGDIFDYWVLRHASSLLVEDAKKDFRFDLEKLNMQNLRPISSLISAPFIAQHRILGILRLDSAQSGLYTQDDLRFLVSLSDLGSVALENADLFQKTQILATHDGLTGLFTKGFFLERLKEEYHRAIRDRADLSLLMLDIDYFKKYNDKFGHIAGDIVLKKISGLMHELLKNYNPIIGRFGGEEFCVILSRIDKLNALKIAQELCDQIAKTRIILRRQETGITVSIGQATLPQDARDQEELIFKADQAMLAAKQKGKNRVVSA